MLKLLSLQAHYSQITVLCHVQGVFAYLLQTVVTSSGSSSNTQFAVKILPKIIELLGSSTVSVVLTKCNHTPKIVSVSLFCCVIVSVT